MAPPQWAYQVENFVAKPDEELICSVCHSVFCDPVMSPCDHVFCRACITKWLQNNRNCPICRKRVPRYSIKEIVPIVKNLIMKLTLYCHNKDLGCEAQVSLESCESHLKECAFELLPCKNKPCKEKLFRKDLEKHESKDCPHRNIKCSLCGSKISLQSHEAHNCITSLHLRLKRKNALLKKKNERIKELKEEINRLKEAPAVASQSSVSSVSDFSPDIRINIAESASSSSDISSDSYFAIIASSDSDSSPENQSDTFEEFIASLRDHQLENSVYLDESHNADSQNNDGNESGSNDANNSPEGSNAGQEQSSSAENRSQRRPHKRSLHYQSSSSEDEANAGEHQSWSSPKRQWMSSPSEHANTSSEAAGVNSSDRATDPGTSHGFNEEGRASHEDSDLPAQLGASADQSARTMRRPISRRRKQGVSSLSPPGRAIFENTLALLEQYNFESDPEWLPQYASHSGDTPSPTESESSFDEFEFQSGSNSGESSSEDE